MSSASRGSTGSASIPSNVLEMVAEAAWNASASACTIRNTMRPVSALANFLTTHGRRARISRSIPFKRRDEPSVADGGSGHSATNDGVVLMPRSDVRSGAVKIAAATPVINFRKELRCLSAESMSLFARQVPSWNDSSHSRQPKSGSNSSLSTRRRRTVRFRRQIHPLFGSPNHRDAACAASSGSGMASAAQATTLSGRTSTALKPSRSLASPAT
jgi:hypothetical protein